MLSEWYNEEKYRGNFKDKEYLIICDEGGGVFYKALQKCTNYVLNVSISYMDIQIVFIVIGTGNRVSTYRG